MKRFFITLITCTVALLVGCDKPASTATQSSDTKSRGTIGVSLLIQNVAQNSRLGFGPNPKAFPALFPSQQLHFGALTVSTHQLVVLGVALSLLGVLYWIVHHTRIGTAMRALSFNATAASLVGINNDRIISFTFGL